MLIVKNMTKQTTETEQPSVLVETIKGNVRKLDEKKQEEKKEDKKEEKTKQEPETTPPVTKMNLVCFSAIEFPPLFLFF